MSFVIISNLGIKRLTLTNTVIFCFYSISKHLHKYKRFLILCPLKLSVVAHFGYHSSKWKSTGITEEQFFLTLKAPRKILEQSTICFYFLFFRENNAWHYMWIVCPADDSHVMSSIISSEKYIEHALKMSSASHDWRFKGWFMRTVCIVGTCQNCLSKAILTSTHNICFF